MVLPGLVGDEEETMGLPGLGGGGGEEDTMGLPGLVSGWGRNHGSPRLGGWMGKRPWLSRLGGKNGMGPGLLNLQSSSIYVQGQQDQIIVPLWYNTISYFSCATAPLLKYLTCSSPQKLTYCFLGISIMLVVLFSLTFAGLNCKACLCEA